MNRTASTKTVFIVIILALALFLISSVPEVTSAPPKFCTADGSATTDTYPDCCNLDSVPVPDQIGGICTPPTTGTCTAVGTVPGPTDTCCGNAKPVPALGGICYDCTTTCSTEGNTPDSTCGCCGSLSTLDNLCVDSTDITCNAGMVLKACKFYTASSTGYACTSEPTYGHCCQVGDVWYGNTCTRPVSSCSAATNALPCSPSSTSATNSRYYCSDFKYCNDCGADNLVWDGGSCSYVTVTCPGYIAVNTACTLYTSPSTGYQCVGTEPGICRQCCGPETVGDSLSCENTPSCVMSGYTCSPPGGLLCCVDGQVASQGHCCDAGKVWDGVSQCVVPQCGASTTGTSCASLTAPALTNYYCTSPANVCCAAGTRWNAIAGACVVTDRCTVETSGTTGPSTYRTSYSDACCSVGPMYGMPSWEDWTGVTVY